MDHLLEGRKLNKIFANKERQTHALKDADLTLDEGEFLGVVGESGSGKSTLLRVIAGLQKPDSGTVLFRGEDISDMSAGERGKHMQMIFQDALSSFDPRMSMKKSIMESGRGRSDDHRIRELAEITGLDEQLLDRRPSDLSGGQCQRMSIIRALYSGVNILLCDEITSALDVSSQAQIMRILGDLRDRKGLSLIFVSHDIALVNSLCNRVMVMKDGCVMEEGVTSEVVNTPGDEYTKSLIMSARRQSLSFTDRAARMRDV